MDDATLALATGASALATALAVVLAVRAARAHGEGDEAAPDEADRSRMAWLGRPLRPTEALAYAELRRRLARAGRRRPRDVDRFNATRMGCLLASTLLFFTLLVAFGAVSLLFGGLLLGAGFYGPVLALRMATERRQARLDRALPAALDLLVTCMEAGLSLEHALARVAGELSPAAPELAEEWSVVVAEIRAGLGVQSAFRQLAERTTGDEMRALCHVVVHSAALGASLGRALREHAAAARARRLLGLEEAAGRLSAGLTLPLTLCLLPAAILAILGPAILLIIESLAE